MNDLSLISNEVKTMSSKEIASLTGKDLSNVHRDIRGMLVELHGDGSDLNHIIYQGVTAERDDRGYVKVFHLDYSHTMTLITGYNIKLRKAVVDRWDQLENEKKALIPNFANPVEAAEAWIAQYKEIEAQKLLIAKQAPAVEFVENYMEANGTYNLRATAKALKTPERVFLQWAKERSILFKMSEVWYPSSDHLKNGNFIVRIFERNGQAGKQTMVTPKGLAWLAKMLEKDKAEGKIVVAKK